VVKLFQIEEPDGSPSDPDAPGMAVGIDLGGAQAEVAVAVGGNPTMLYDRDGFESDLPTPPLNDPPEVWQSLFEGARLRAERALARPVTHAVLVVPSNLQPEAVERLVGAAQAAGLDVLRVVGRDDIPAGEAPALAAAALAEDLAPRPAAN
jgi:molecular chaperone DnaK (HSP70)